MAKATVTKMGLASLQVCVPQTFSDEEVVAFVNAQSPTGLEHGWQIRREGDPVLDGDPERNGCDKHNENVHIMLDC